MIATLVLVGALALAAAAVHDARSRRHEESQRLMESVLCSGTTCDIESRV